MAAVDSKSHGIADENTAYRRGLVMGLTMAEVGLLIIFVLLLLLAFSEWLRQRESVLRQGAVVVPQDRMILLEGAERAIADVTAVLDMPPNALPKDVVRMVRAAQAIASKGAGETALAAVAAEMAALEGQRAQLQQTAARLEAGTSPEAIAMTVERLSEDLADKEGQLRRYESQLRTAGLGKGERPCWVKADGTIEYLYDVVLETSGIRMREISYPLRQDARAELPMPDINPNETLTDAEFLRRTKPLYAASVAKNCRFFVSVFDATGPSEKDLYKARLRAVEGHFYKRLNSGRADF